MGLHNFSNIDIIRETFSSLFIAKRIEKDHAQLMREISSMEQAWAVIHGRLDTMKFKLIKYNSNDELHYELLRSQWLFIATQFNDEQKKHLLSYLSFKERIWFPRLEAMVKEMEIQIKQLKQQQHAITS